MQAMLTTVMVFCNSDGGCVVMHCCRDACGTAGGTNSTYEGPGNTFFSTVKVNGSKSIKMGDLGSVVLPAGPSMATYQIGSPVEVKWGLRFNHGGELDR